jgi:DNA invertase Pin-like site-specific DNA recombinase
MRQAGHNTGKRFVTYYRVSTEKQGRSGLGLDAQKASVTAFLSPHDKTVASFTEVETGKRNDRPVLTEAIAHAKAYGATLLIAKLDRLSRNAAFLLTLQDQGVPFVAADMPTANHTVIGILAVIAQAEREAISTRTKAALAQAKTHRGNRDPIVRPGFPTVIPVALCTYGRHACGASASSPARHSARQLPV